MPIPATFNRATQNIRNRASRMTRTQKLSAAGVAVVGASVLAVSVVPGAVQASGPAGHPPAAGAVKVVGAPSSAAPAEKTDAARAELAKRLLDATHQAQAHASTAAKAKAEAAQAKKAEVAKKAAAAERAAVAERAAAATKAEAAKSAAKLAAKFAPKNDVKKAVKHPAETQVKTVAKAAPEYPNNLNGWIREALAVMKKHHIPGSYDGIHRNIIRESSGNPKAINLWDINAKNGIPSKGLLQVIPPTFATYHVEGTSKNIYDPVANIVAACNYAADRYGSMDNVNSAY